jgi:hypothetical protein
MLLSSSIDGEVLSAVRTIERLLKRYDRELSDLADHISAEVPAATPPPTTQATWGTPGRELSAGQLGEIIVAIRAHGRLTHRAREFLIDLEARTQLYPSVRLSPKQHDWLLSLAETAAARMPS